MKVQVNSTSLQSNASMRLSINKNMLKPVLITITAIGTIGLGYLGCQVFGRVAMFTTAGCIGGLGGTATLIENLRHSKEEAIAPTPAKK